MCWKRNGWTYKDVLDQEGSTSTLRDISNVCSEAIFSIESNTKDSRKRNKIQTVATTCNVSEESLDKKLIMSKIKLREKCKEKKALKYKCHDFVKNELFV